ncbi:MAG: hypothetical protein ACXVDE_03865, partial [Tumebacillaceae bacterium]
QGNSHARLYVKNVATGKETSIPVEIHTERIKGLSENSRGTHWVQLTPTGTPDRYQLTTTDYLRIPMEKFDIDIGTGTSKRLE